MAELSEADKRSLEAFELAKVTVDALGVFADDGYLRIYGGSIPKNPESPITTQELLVEFELGSPISRVLCGAVVSSGRATWFRVYTNKEQVAWQGAIPDDLQFDDCQLKLGGHVIIENFGIEIPIE